MFIKSRLMLWVLRIVPALIMLQTLFFKFTASEESVYIFSKLGMEPWGRIGSGVMELIAGVLLLVPAATVYGAALGLGIMTGALTSHLTVLGIEVMDDGGQLFIYACLTSICCFILLINFRKQLSLLRLRSSR